MSKAEINTTGLFIDRTKAPNKDDQGIIDIGKNCSKCNQLDFLPFQCEFCNQVFCSNHRTLDQHDCKGKAKFEKGKVISRHSDHLGSVQSLFPDRDANKRTVEQKLAAAKPKPTTILETQFRVGDVAKNASNAFSKFNKFLKLQKKKNLSSGSTLGKLFTSSTKTPKPKPTNSVVDLALLRKLAKGDIKVAVGDRIYIWCLYINPKNTDSETVESEELSKINIDKDKKPIYISKNWPVGRALDSIADQLSIRNFNNSTNELSERLNIFKLKDEVPTLMKASDRCNTSFKNCDTIYLVKGSI
ncbi:uncharacterized protein CANTADRAFT_49939 [Suhomyces tanzawaensis NRRL Y-17324]|uniref:AN1-type domain-containing protein n=1 Tax=Suhomyces tanzawaensis NRRL Y-17324 TaxID=984487 RepID=A0A1E4SLH3_9ASCO|nr:uncharacterized protein CANTADRAFT_49939 [Suhomyces tanzawaensis NRRL Y-17324]ODV80385.1 hypothetical protein CANTADRAFT_49939 [Suhomyces tanzawaensis NRRL Y-17324]